MLQKEVDGIGTAATLPLIAVVIETATCMQTKPWLLHNHQRIPSRTVSMMLAWGAAWVRLGGHLPVGLRIGLCNALYLPWQYRQLLSMVMKCNAALSTDAGVEAFK